MTVVSTATTVTTARGVRPAMMIYGAIAFVLFVLVALFARGNLTPPITSAAYNGPSTLEGWFRYDGVWYRSIAQDGYFFRGDDEISSVAFFPVYPLLMRGLHSVFGGDAAVWGIVITVLSGLTASLLFYRWCIPRIGEIGARYALAALLLWPYGWYLFGAVYADALFVALVIGAFSLLERDRLVWATALGAIATATRPVGVAVVVGLFVRALERGGVFSLPRFDRPRFAPHTSLKSPVQEGDDGRPLIRFDLSKWRLRAVLPLLSVVGLVLYGCYLAAKFGDPLAFATAEQAPGWDMKPGPRTWFKTELLDRLIHFPNKGVVYTGGLVIQAGLAFGLLALARRVGREFGWGYAVYVIVVLAIPIVNSKDFQGIGRYCLSAFPAFAVMGLWLAERPRLARQVLVVSGLTLSLMCVAFARGKYLA